MKSEIIKFMYYCSVLFNAQNIMLLFCAAVRKLPYEYYIFLRYSVFIGMIVNIIPIIISITKCPHKKGDMILEKILYTSAVLCIGIAVLFNPIEPIHLNRTLWMFIDIFVAFYSGISIVLNLGGVPDK